MGLLGIEEFGLGGSFDSAQRNLQDAEIRLNVAQRMVTSTASHEGGVPAWARDQLIRANMLFSDAATKLETARDPARASARSASTNRHYGTDYVTGSQWRSMKAQDRFNMARDAGYGETAAGSVMFKDDAPLLITQTITDRLARTRAADEEIRDAVRRRHEVVTGVRVPATATALDWRRAKRIPESQFQIESRRAEYGRVRSEYGERGVEVLKEKRRQAYQRTLFQERERSTGRAEFLTTSRAEEIRSSTRKPARVFTDRRDATLLAITDMSSYYRGLGPQEKLDWIKKYEPKMAGHPGYEALKARLGVDAYAARPLPPPTSYHAPYRTGAQSLYVPRTAKWGGSSVAPASPPVPARPRTGTGAKPSLKALTTGNPAFKQMTDSQKISYLRGLRSSLPGKSGRIDDAVAWYQARISRKASSSRHAAATAPAKASALVRSSVRTPTQTLQDRVTQSRASSPTRSPVANPYASQARHGRIIAGNKLYAGGGGQQVFYRSAI